MIRLRITKRGTTARSRVSLSETISRTLLLVLTTEVATLVSVACGGSSPVVSPPSGNTPPTTYTIGGTVSGLSGTGLVLQNNAGNNLPIGGNGSFTFSTPVNSGATYDVSVATQPSNPTQGCGVSNGTGTANANVTTIQVVCTNAANNEWTWVSGANLVNQPGVYGSLGTASPTNVPGARQNPVGWTDALGNLWLFGGYGFDSTGQVGDLNDLWKYSAGEWIWMGGANVVNQPGVFGTLGAAAPGNIPGARDSGVSWTDASGNFWLFGGTDHDDSTNTGGFLNDLWKYSAGEWTWMGGSNLPNQLGTYGTQGTAAPGNIPGARVEAVNWTDAAGNLWLFGGYGFGSSAGSGNFNDLWKYSAGEWTWMGGSNVYGQPATYGIQGTAASSNVPGARNSAVSWTDASGNFWLFGGNGLDSVGASDDLNDLWKYSAGEWTWMGGSNVVNQPGSYGTLGATAPGSVPGARQNLVSWTDPLGNAWLLGGYGLDSTGQSGNLNDLWKYSAGEWTWMGGLNVVNQQGSYGTLGAAAPGNVPGARNSATTWTDASGNLWLFGGSGYDSTGASSYLNDLWKYGPE
jgi:N-acetylneuraminic acid mutarotase